MELLHPKLHVISFDVPWPADYGGAIDVYYRLKALSHAGVEVILHAYEYGRGKPIQLEGVCSKVYYYKRKMLLNPLKGGFPYIVRSRNSSLLLTRLLQDDAPILFEGTHSTALLNHPALAERKRVVRMHNIEADYYLALSKVEKNPAKSLYLKKEAERLARYEKDMLKQGTHVLAISLQDQEVINNTRSCCTTYLPVFHGFEEPAASSYIGNYALYHGNLGIAENQVAAQWLITQVFSHTSTRLIVAGNGAPSWLVRLCDKQKNVRLLSGLSPSAINQLVAEGAVHVLPTFQPTGMKLKFINTLFNGSHIIANAAMLPDETLADVVHLSEDPYEWAALVDKLANQPFTAADLAKRKVLLQPYQVAYLTNKLMDILFADSSSTQGKVADELRSLSR